MCADHPPTQSHDTTNDDVAAMTVLARWQRRVEETPSAPAIAYFDGRYSVREIDELANSLAVSLSERAVGPGDRVGIHLQNIPQYAVTMLACWKIGAIALVLNPMYRGRELAQPVVDAGAVGIITTDRDLTQVRESAATLLHLA